MSTVTLALVGAPRPHARPRAPVGDRVAVAGGAIAAVGSDAEIRELAGRGDRGRSTSTARPSCPG